MRIKIGLAILPEHAKKKKKKTSHDSYIVFSGGLHKFISNRKIEQREREKISLSP
ncbi:hypothetical protein PDIP_70260 [Penicillium digitatum Pd1]|uniref:Uncharacterized protein n=1 Tax=Penicillium digitatum (strain Pd1 / CECT 20795) TaxID=1170230 RepID=K9FZF7_PEND1|nr:hypothetical protein PDIP_70260 [Penicillium digitatum Pd1]EKV08063.1 hypothetical protein PDIP_70260 [Penicillium digitatum Pd1]